MTGMIRVTFIDNVFSQADRHVMEGQDLLSVLQTRWDKWPDGAALYKDSLHESCNITPTDEAGAERLGELRGAGEFFVVRQPGDPTGGFLLISLLVAVAAVAFLAPKVPAVAQGRNYSSSSSNNDLSDRVNRPRVNGRIPDIYGEVISVPDLLALPYTVYDTSDTRHKPVEYAYMCVGRGEYQVASADIKDGTTPVSQIEDMQVSVWGPGTSPNTPSGTPQLNIGGAIGEKVLLVAKSNAVNGQVLLAPNDDALDHNVRFQLPGDYGGANANGKAKIKVFDLGATPHADLTTLFTAGGTVTVQADDVEYRFGFWETPEVGAPFQNFVITNRNHTGTYTIDSVSTDTLELTDASLNSSWNVPNSFGSSVPGESDRDNEGLWSYENYPSNETLENTHLTSSGVDTWVGPFICDLTNMEGFIVNIVAPQGMYKDDGTEQTSTDVDVEIGYRPVNSSGTPTGAETIVSATVTGSAVTTSLRAITVRNPSPLTAGRYRIRARRVTPRDLGFTGTIVDEVQWRDLYATHSSTVPEDFGDVTTIHAKTVGNVTASSIKERKLNAKVTRKINILGSGGSYGSTPTATKDAGSILCAIALDPKIGGRTTAELDLAGIRTAVDAVTTRFGHASAGWFSHTFDDDNTSLEEMLEAVATAVFCTAYRQGNVIKLAFESPINTPDLIFNHRNKIPKTEQRTVVFGIDGDYDGVEYEYRSPDDDAASVIYVPADQSATNAKRIQSVGVRHPLQAYFQAHRAWNRLQYQKLVVEFDALQEAMLLVRNSRVLVADNTRAPAQDGEVVSYNSSTNVLRVSQPVVFSGGVTYQCFLQYPDGTVGAIGATAGADDYSIVLASDPPVAISTSRSNAARATFVLIGDTDKVPRHFLVAESTPQSAHACTVKAVNYDARYYQNDTDYIDEVVDVNGVLL